MKHCLFWGFILALHIFRSGQRTIDPSRPEFKALVVEHTLMLPLLIMTSYFFAYYLMPASFSTRKFTRLILYALCAGTVAIMLMRLILYFYIIPVFYAVPGNPSAGFWNFNLAKYLFYIFSTVAIVLMIRYASMMRKMERERNQLEKQNLAGELALLRSQVNPHFLFNTLNNINALVSRDPERTSRSIVRLSNIMRYMLHEAANERVSLAKEVEYLNSYIELLSLRIDRTDYIKFIVTGKPDNIMIPPMLFIPFVENAFKHGLKDADPPGIVINLDIVKKEIRFRVENLIKPASVGNIPAHHGIGLANLKRRLGLLYPGRHKLEVNSDGFKFICSLEIMTFDIDHYPVSIKYPV
jgi:two-component system LytT family sensor kinase